MEREVETAALFVDVSGSTKLYETAGDKAALAAIEQCIAIFRETTAAEGGIVIKTIGDEVMARFPSANAAANAAIDMQTAIAAMPPVAGTQLGIRIGFYFGPAVERDGDLFGDTVNLAARLAGLAIRGQIMTTMDTAQRMTPVLRASSRPLHAIPVKGKAQEIALCEIMWQQSDEATTMVADRPAAIAQTTVRLRYHEAEIYLDANRASLSLGRDAGSDLVILDRKASRNHGGIERRGSKYILSDHSANGTYVTVEGDSEIVLRREQFILRGHGWITFGQPRAETEEVVEYFVE